MLGPLFDAHLPPPTEADLQPQHAPSLDDDLTVPQAEGPAVALPLPERIGRYRLHERLADGGMGSIYRVHDAAFGRDLALKVLRAEHHGRADLRERFLNEARIAARLQHPCIIPIYDLGELPDGRPFFTMRLVQGCTLASFLADRPAPGVNLPHLIKVFEKICQAMAFAHSHGVIHRDLKPSNVMVAPFGVVKVMDWGIAKELDGAPEEAFDAEPAETVGSAGTEFGRVMGTPAYMPPEQARAEAVDERADVFGLGAILCEILTGMPPHAGKTRAAHRRAARGDLTRALAALAECRAERAVVELACRCLEQDPARRPASAGEVAHAVTAYLESDQHRAERDLARFFDLSLDLFCLAGLDGHFRRVNPNFSRVLGYPDDELIRRPFLDFVHDDDRPATQVAMEQLARGLPVVRFRNRYRDVRGQFRWFEWTAKAVPNEGLVFAVARDITDRLN
jgi:PAS domain S-box-containing protein